eukprot:3168172-Rhodomonas_salina.4
MGCQRCGANGRRARCRCRAPRSWGAMTGGWRRATRSSRASSRSSSYSRTPAATQVASFLLSFCVCPYPAFETLPLALPPTRSCVCPTSCLPRSQVRALTPLRATPSQARAAWRSATLRRQWPVWARPRAPPLSPPPSSLPPSPPRPPPPTLATAPTTPAPAPSLPPRPRCVFSPVRDALLQAWSEAAGRREEEGVKKRGGGWEMREQRVCRGCGSSTVQKRF